MLITYNCVAQNDMPFYGIFVNEYELYDDLLAILRKPGWIKFRADI